MDSLYLVLFVNDKTGAQHPFVTFSLAQAEHIKEMFFRLYDASEWQAVIVRSVEE